MNQQTGEQLTGEQLNRWTIKQTKNQTDQQIVGNNQTVELFKAVSIIAQHSRCSHQVQVHVKHKNGVKAQK